MRIEGTPVLERNLDSKARIIVNRGGTRSSKTFSLQQKWIIKSYQNANKNYLVTSSTWPHLRLTAYKDIQDILSMYNLWGDFTHNKTYHFFKNRKTGSCIHYISADNEMRVRGQAWDDFEMTEANAMKYDLFRQLIMRCPGQAYLDFNPSEEHVWINTEIEQKRDDFELIKSSYKDNPFLHDEVIKEIEYLRDTDPVYWNIFGLGEYGELKHKIYNNYEIVSESEYDNTSDHDMFYGNDFGYVNPWAFIEMKHNDGIVYLREKYYKSWTEPNDFINWMGSNDIHYNDPIYCDSADPLKISQIHRSGYNAKKSNKHVKEGIDFCRRFKFKVCRSSVNTIKEFNNYKYQEDKDGNIIEEPVKFLDHAMDAIRYGVTTHLQHMFYD